MLLLFMLQAQQVHTAHVQATAHAIAYASSHTAPPAYTQGVALNVLYPTLDEYMGMRFTPEMMAVVPAAPSQV